MKEGSDQTSLYSQSIESVLKILDEPDSAGVEGDRSKPCRGLWYLVCGMVKSNRPMVEDVVASRSIAAGDCRSISRLIKLAGKRE